MFGIGIPELIVLTIIWGIFYYFKYYRKKEKVPNNIHPIKVNEKQGHEYPLASINSAPQPKSEPLQTETNKNNSLPVNKIMYPESKEIGSENSYLQIDSNVDCRTTIGKWRKTEIPHKNEHQPTQKYSKQEIERFLEKHYRKIRKNKNKLSDNISPIKAIENQMVNYFPASINSNSQSSYVPISNVACEDSKKEKEPDNIQPIETTKRLGYEYVPINSNSQSSYVPISNVACEDSKKEKEPDNIQPIETTKRLGYEYVPINSDPQPSVLSILLCKIFIGQFFEERQIFTHFTYRV